MRTELRSCNNSNALIENANANNISEIQKRRAGCKPCQMPRVHVRVEGRPGVESTLQRRCPRRGVVCRGGERWLQEGGGVAGVRGEGWDAGVTGVAEGGGVRWSERS